MIIIHKFRNELTRYFYSTRIDTTESLGLQISNESETNVTDKNDR